MARPLKREPLPFRCGARREDAPAATCGAPAGWLRPFSDPRLEHFVCTAHKRDGDRPIPADAVVRIVSLSAVVLMGGTSREPGLAQLEAVERLEAAVEAAGGRVVLRRVTSFLAQAPGRTAAGETRGPVGIVD